LEDYQTYLSETPDEINRWEMMMRPIIDRSANLIESASKIPKGRLLDVGCGYGFFLREMKSRGWQVEGVEVSRVGRRYTAENWGIPVHPLPLEDLGLAGSVFDVVTLFYIIEHVHDPLRLLFETKRVLKPGGVVLLRWPHSTPIVRMLGPLSKRFDIYHTPYHLFDFSPKTIAMALIRCGFENPKTIIGGYTHPNNRLGRWASLGFGKIGEALYLLSGGAVLFPGISKTTMAFKAF
jgi:SAM-dependent methyltransferase